MMVWQKIRPLPLNDVNILDQFWCDRIETARSTSIEYMWKALNDQIDDIPPSHCIANFRVAAGLEEGEFKGYVFQDSDLYKWLEAVGYSLMTHPDADLERRADEAIELAGAAQRADGYLDTYYIINGLDKRWTNLCANHEMYVAGHMMEAACAYYLATGKDRLLNIACRFADHIDSVFGPEPGKKRGVPGHQEIELGLARLYRVTGEMRYLNLAKFFLDERGQKPFYFDEEAKNYTSEELQRMKFFPNHGVERYSYQQAHKPVREQTEAVGHAVRLGYMLAAMAEVGALAGDETLDAAAQTLWEDVVNRQMYITAGIGSMGDGEAFSFDYDLPNDFMYTETCASISLLMTAQRLFWRKADASYGDIAERALFNGILSGVSLDGKKYFYTNPMEMWPERCARRHDMHVDAERQGWFGCACCPPNVLRTLTGLGQYLYGKENDTLYVNQYVASDAAFEIDGRRITLSQRGQYPWNGRIQLSVDADAHFTLALRIPGWCRSAQLRVNGQPVNLDALMHEGYALLSRDFCATDEIVLEMEMPVERVYCNDHVPFNAGRVALMRGPLVYCIEQEDNGGQLWNLRIGTEEPRAQFQPDLLNGVTTLEVPGTREVTDDALYSVHRKQERPCQITFVPYWAWCNRTPGEMMVWVREG